MNAKANGTTNVIHAIVRMVMAPFVRILLRYGVAHSDFVSITKKLYVEIAANEFTIDERKQSVARVAVLTGLTRREVKTMLDEPTEHHPPLELNRAGRVAEAWLRDETFWDTSGQPAALSLKSKDPKSFDGLVRKYGGDIPTRSVRDELIRSGAIRKVGDTVVIGSTGYVPSGDSEELLKVSFRSVEQLISTIDHNDQHGQEDPRLQLTVEYDNISSEGADTFRILSREKSKELLIYLDRFLATQDRDLNPALDEGKDQFRTGLSIFYFKDDNNTKQEDNA